MKGGRERGKGKEGRREGEKERRKGGRRKEGGRIKKDFEDLLVEGSLQRGIAMPCYRAF